jgi:uncharacterized protein DUF4129
LLAVGLVLGAVAIVSGGDGAHGGGSDRRPSEWLLDVAVSFLLVAMAIGAVLTAALLVLRPQELDPLERAARRRGRMWAALVLVVLLAIVALGARNVMTGNGRGFAFGLFGGAGPTGDLQNTADRYEPHFATAPTLVLVALVALAVLGWTVARRAKRAGSEVDVTLQSALEELLDDSVDDLRAETDPRRAVIATYARLERVLAAHDVPRRPSEAPDEYLRRVLESVELSRPAVTRLTALFQRAKFSQHDVDMTMKEEAIDALVSARDELRAARLRAEQERAEALARAREQVEA